MTAALTMSLSVGAVLTFTSASLSAKAQAVFGGTLSVVAVVLVTTMVFWMRRAARTLSGELSGKVGSALAVGGAGLVLTAFFAVGREGLETALFVWTNAQAAGSNVAPVTGALVGLALAGGLCVAMYRRLVTVDVSLFFARTGAVLLVIAAGVLAYGIGDLQEAEVLPGQGQLAFDLTARLPSGAWWVELVRGVTNLDPRMSWLQVASYLGFLVVALPRFLLGHRNTLDGSAVTSARPVHRSRLRLVGLSVIVIPALVALTLVVGNRGSQQARSAVAIPITITDSACAAGWVAPPAGRVTFAVNNASRHPVDVELGTGVNSDLVAEIEILGPGTTRTLSPALSSGPYAWNCRYDGAPARTSAVQTVVGSSPEQSVVLLKVTAGELAPVLTAYQSYVAQTLARLQTQTRLLRADLAAGDAAKAKADWLTAHLTYHRIGAAYDAFGAAGDAVDGLAQGLPGGVHDPGFVGFHKIELELWGGRRPQELEPQAGALARAVDVLEKALPTFTLDPDNLTLRTHEILEGSARFSLTGQDDYGSGSSIATALADAEGTQTLVGLLTPVLERRAPGLAARAKTELRTLRAGLEATQLSGRWVALSQLTLTQRQHLNAEIGQVLETLSVVPDLLKIRA